MSATPITSFTNGTLVLPDGTLDNGTIVSTGGVITALGKSANVRLPESCEVVDAHGGLLAPGYVDIHVHGGAGADFMDGTVAAVRTAARAHARRGTTSIFPTTTTGSPAQIARMLLACKSLKASWTPQDGAWLAGVHFYGPYFAEKKVGCHSVDGRRDPDPQ